VVTATEVVVDLGCVVVEGPCVWPVVAGTELPDAPLPPREPDVVLATPGLGDGSSPAGEIRAFEADGNGVSLLRDPRRPSAVRFGETVSS
jgi:hypothetical protein